jgi:hypothetical protein
LGDARERGWTARTAYPTSRRRGRWRSILEERAVRSSELGSAVDHGYAEPAMDHSVMRSTQEHEIRQSGVAAVGPVANVVRVGPAGWTLAARETTSAVTNSYRSTERRRNDLRLAAELQRLGRRICDHACDRRVAGETASGLWRDRPYVLERRASAGASLQRNELIAASLSNTCS